MLLQERADEEIHFRPGAAADPVALQQLDALGPIQAVQVALQAIGIGGDPQHPLPQRHADDGMAAALAQAPLDLLVGQHGAQGGTPVDRRFQLIGQPVLVAIGGGRVVALLGHVLGNGQLGDGAAPLRGRVEPGVEQHQEDELGPAEVIGLRGGQFPLPVVGKAQHLQLPAEVGDILLRGRAGVGAGSLGMLLGGQAEGVPAHRVHHAATPHPPVAADDVGGGVAFRVADVQAVPAGVGEHVEHVNFRPFRQSGGGEGAVLFPVFLPFRLDGGGIVTRHGAVCLWRMALGQVPSPSGRGLG